MKFFSQSGIHRPHIGYQGRLVLGLLLIGALLGSQQARASFKLESTGVILKEKEGRTSFNVENISAEPILLVTKVSDLDKNGVSKNILISPPVVRIDPGQSQQVNFVLKQGTVLNHEVLLKASFEGVSQASESSAKMPIRQDVGLLVIPAGVAETKTPWDDLTLKYEGNELVISNNGKHVVRMAPQFTVLPSKEVIPLGSLYILPTETKRFKVKSKPNAIEISPLSRYGFKQQDVTISAK
ncbi:TPA: fimbria/pilus periplasmic chaperone [Serratia fonticola]|nr:fimbria/pilus periplasmic chaperone [Serratia fonticola]